MAESRDARTDAFNAYFLYSGSVFFGFGRAESTLAATLRVFLGSRLKASADTYYQRFALAAATLGVERFAGLKDRYKRILRLQEPSGELVTAVDAVFSQMGDIQFLRDRMAHYLIKPLNDDYDGQWMSQDYATTKDFANSRTYAFHTDALKGAFLDLKVLPNLLSDVLGNPDAKIELPAWHYKSSMLVLVDPISLHIPG